MCIKEGWWIPVAIVCAFFVFIFYRIFKNKFLSDKTLDEYTIEQKKTGLRAALIVLCLVMLIPIGMSINNYLHPTGYYNTNTGVYYHIGSEWYHYNDYTSDWDYIPSVDYGRTDYAGNTWQSDWGNTSYSFTNSDAYRNYIESHESNSDYDSWDSGDTDWGSDW